MKLGINLCVRCETRWIENKDTGLCASCSHDDRKADRTKVKVVKPVKKVTEKRNIQNQEYARLRKEYLESYPACEVVECNNQSNQIHHMAGRENERLTDTNYFLAVCPDCHERITKDTQWAVANGYSILRTVNLNH